MEPILEVKNVSKVYGTRYVLRNINFNIFAGEIFGFIGPNGAGKSTLMRIITGMSTPTDGDVKICGYSVQQDFEKAIINIGATIENTNLYGYMTAKQNLTYYASLYTNVSPSRIIETLELVGLKDRMNDPIKDYSLGMRQKIGLAQALLHEPKLLILDEPTNGLDAESVIHLRQILRTLAAERNIAVLLSSHNLSEVEQLCDTIAFVDHGSVIETQTMNKIKKETSESSRFKIRLNYPNYSAKMIFLKFNVPVEVVGDSVLVPCEDTLLPKILDALRARDIQVYAINVETKSLEDLYIDIIKSHNHTK